MHSINTSNVSHRITVLDVSQYYYYTIPVAGGTSTVPASFYRYPPPLLHPLHSMKAFIPSFITFDKADLGLNGTKASYNISTGVQRTETPKRDPMIRNRNPKCLIHAITKVVSIVNRKTDNKLYLYLCEDVKSQNNESHATMTNNNQRSSPSWIDYMTQSTIHKRNVARQQRRLDLESKGGENQQHLPVTIRVWRQMFTSTSIRPLAVNHANHDVDNDNITDAYDRELNTWFHQGQIEEQSWYPTYYTHDAMPVDESVFTWSITSSDSTSPSLSTATSSNSNLSSPSMLLSALIATGSAMFAATQIRRFIIPKHTIPHFAVPFATLVGTDGLHHQIAALPIQRIIYQHNLFEISSIESLLHWTKEKSNNRATVFLFAICGYNVLSTAIFSQRT